MASTAAKSLKSYSFLIVRLGARRQPMVTRDIWDGFLKTTLQHTVHPLITTADAQAQRMDVETLSKAPLAMAVPKVPRLSRQISIASLTEECTWD